MISFKVKKITEREKVGNILKKAREKRGLDLSQVEKRLKIRKKYLEALEQENWDILPGEVFLRGFLQKYAKFLGLDAQKILELYKRERVIQEKIEEKTSSKIPQPINSPKIVITPRFLAIVFGILVFLGIFGYITYQFSNLVKPPFIEITNPSQDIETDQEVIYLEGRTQKGADLYVNNQMITVDENGFFKTLVYLQNGMNVLKIVARNEMGKETIVERRIFARLPQKTIANSPNQSPQVPVNKHTLTLKFSPSSVWILVKLDGKEIFQGVMLPGTQKTFEFEKELVLSVGNAGSTEVILDGKSLGKLGQEGEVKKEIRFP